MKHNCANGDAVSWVEAADCDDDRDDAAGVVAGRAEQLHRRKLTVDECDLNKRIVQ